MPDLLLDDFHDLKRWTAIAAGAAQLRLSVVADGGQHALRLDYDLAGGGFVIARRALDLTLPEDYAFVLECSGSGAQHIVEFKLVDEQLANVWRLRDENFALRESWTPWHIAARDIAYAWGARRTRRLAHCDALEIAIVGAGAGSLLLRDLRLHDQTYAGIPHICASSTQLDHPAHHVLHDDARYWLSEAGGEQSLRVSFDHPRAFSALHIDWQRDALPVAFAIDVIDEQGAWQCRHEAHGRPGPRSTVLLPGTCSRSLRLRISAGGPACAVRHVAFAPWYYAANLLDGLSSLALDAPLGHYPKTFREQQSYWTVTGAADGSAAALLNTEGLIEVDGGDFALEAMLQIDARLYTWAEVQLDADLADESLPLPRVRWRAADITLEIAPVMTGSGAQACLHVRYRLSNHSTASRACTLYLLVRPYLVTPVWQLWQGRGGIAALHRLGCDAGGMRINDTRRLFCAVNADACGVQQFATGDIVAGLRDGVLPTAREVADRDGLASGVFAFVRTLAAHSSVDILVAVPARGGDALTSTAAPAHDVALHAWRALLGPAPISLPAACAAPALTLRTAAAHILVHRDGARLQPGPRRYTRAYLRDAVGMGTALARLGLTQPLKDLLDWYGPYQRDDGELPDCVDDNGAEWLPEYDAYGQYLHGVAEAQRLAPEAAFLARQWPRVQRVLTRFEQLRALRTSAAYRGSGYYGLLPESMSHEGYMAQPVHAYWDDFWALRGLHDAAWLAAQVGDQRQAQRIAALAASFATDVHRSIDISMRQHNIDFLPGSVELGDFDATAIAVALTVGDDAHGLPRSALDATFDRYLAIRAAREQQPNWSNYSAYEIRIVGALIRLGRRADALLVLHGLLADCRPPAWRQWPEISWRDYHAPAFLGDLPHSWIGAEYIHALSSAFAYERRADASLVLAAGVDPGWLANEGVTVRALATHYGPLSYRLSGLSDQRVDMHIDAGPTLPPGGLLLRPPLPATLRAVTVNGAPHDDFDDQQCRCHALPAHVVFYCGEARP